MRNTKLILIIIVVLLVAYFIGGWIMTIFWFLMKILFGLMGLGLIIGGYYIGKNWKKNK